MKKLLGIVVLGLLLSGCVTTDEPASQKNNPYKTNNNVKILSQSENYIKFIATPGGLTWPNPLENTGWVSTAKKYCSSIRKNTYVGYKPKVMSYLVPRAWDVGYEENRMVYRFICAKNYSEAENILSFKLSCFVPFGPVITIFPGSIDTLASFGTVIGVFPSLDIN